MSSQEQQKSGKESGSTIDPLKHPTTTTRVDILGDPDVIEVSLNTVPLENIPDRACEGSPGGNTLEGQVDTISPAIPQIQSPTVLSIPRPRISIDKSHDPAISHMQEIAHADAAVPQTHPGSSIPTAGGVRKLSVNEHEYPRNCEKRLEMDAGDILQQIHPLGSLTADATVIAQPTTTNIPTNISSAHDHSMRISLNPQHQSSLRTKNLPRLNLLDLPLLGITASCQDIDAVPPKLERIQDPPPSGACTLNSLDLDSEEKDTYQVAQTTRSSQDLPCQQPSPLPESSLVADPVSNIKSPQVDDSPDDDVTFIVSVPRRRKKRKRAESSAENRPAEEPVGKSNTGTPDGHFISGSTPPRSPTVTTVKATSASQAPDENVPAINAPPITSKRSSTFASSRIGSLQIGACTAPQMTAPTNKSSEGDLSVLERATTLQPLQERACDPQSSGSVAASKSQAVGETAQSLSAKRKVDQAVGEECDQVPVKRSKIQSVQQNEGRSAVAPIDQGQRERCATTTDSLNATSPNNRLQIPNAEISQLRGSSIPTVSSFNLNGQSYFIRSTNAPRSAMTGHVPTSLQDLRRKPSLYSIPSWQSPPMSSNSSVKPRPSADGPYPTNISSQNTQSSKSPPSPGQVSGSQHTQRKSLDRCISSHMAPCPPQTTMSSQPYVMQRSIDNYNRPANTLSTWPVNPFLTVGQQISKDYLRYQPRQFALTPQEYARSLQYAQSIKHGDSGFQQQSRFTISPQMRTVEASQSPSSNGPSQTINQPEALPSTNLLVDIAQTCQAIFPFARIAERHNQPVKKVFDAFSAVIQIPLLQCAADRRHNGKLGNARLKEFRSASKAVSETHEKERKAEKQGAKMRDELAPPPAKKAKGKAKPVGGKGLLGVAIANRQRDASGSK